MNWLSLILQAIGTAVASALSKPAATPEPPAPPPPAPGFADIRRAEDERLARERSSVEPVIVAAPRLPLDALVDSDAAPTERRR